VASSRLFSASGIVGLVVQQKEETMLSKIMLCVAAIILFLIGTGIQAWD